jgi:hypothetical protein
MKFLKSIFWWLAAEVALNGGGGGQLPSLHSIWNRLLQHTWKQSYTFSIACILWGNIVTRYHLFHWWCTNTLFPFITLALRSWTWFFIVIFLRFGYHSLIDCNFFYFISSRLLFNAAFSFSLKGFFSGKIFLLIICSLLIDIFSIG